MEAVTLKMKYRTGELTNHATGWRQRRAGIGQGKAKHSNGMKSRGRMRLIIQGQGPQTEVAIRIKMRERQYGGRLGVETGGKRNGGDGGTPWGEAGRQRARRHRSSEENEGRMRQTTGRLREGRRERGAGMSWEHR